MSYSPDAADLFRFWNIRLHKLLTNADREVGFAGVLQLLLQAESTYAYAARLAAGEDPEK